MRFKQGTIINNEGRVKDIIVDASRTTSWKESIIGCLMIGLGIAYLTNKAFKNGAKAFEEAEYKTMVDLGIIED